MRTRTPKLRSRIGTHSAALFTALCFVHCALLEGKPVTEARVGVAIVRVAIVRVAFVRVAFVREIDGRRCVRQ